MDRHSAACAMAPSNKGYTDMLNIKRGPRTYFKIQEMQIRKSHAIPGLQVTLIGFCLINSYFLKALGVSEAATHKWWLSPWLSRISLVRQRFTMLYSVILFLLLCTRVQREVG
ncbi:hypothetical protein J6590_040687 [Homalodisca vitripennis]|nr:hypothetical protein J6590_040687 [Homalodisca vitripennis]